MKFNKLTIVNFTRNEAVSRVMTDIGLKENTTTLSNVNPMNYIYHFAEKGLIWTIGGVGKEATIRLWRQEIEELEDKKESWQFSLDI